MIYTTWGNLGDDRPHTFTGGSERPRYANGTIMDDCEKLFWVIVASNCDEALMIYHMLQGWMPYKPM